ncbi:unnamed protein product, partial [Staurois parvus]
LRPQTWSLCGGGGLHSEGCRKFFINLGKDAKNFEVHFDIRFDFQGEKHILALNSMEDGVWGVEQRKRIFPFQEGSDTVVCFQLELDKITIQLPSFPVRFAIEEKTSWLWKTSGSSLSHLNKESLNRGAACPMCPYPGSVNWPLWRKLKCIFSSFIPPPPPPHPICILAAHVDIHCALLSPFSTN